MHLKHIELCPHWPPLSDTLIEKGKESHPGGRFSGSPAGRKRPTTSSCCLRQKMSFVRLFCALLLCRSYALC